MRVLHLLDPASGGDESLIACRAAVGIPGVEHLVWIVGDDAAGERARSLGIPLDARLPRTAWTEGAFRGVRRLNGDRFGDLAEPWPDAVQCWSVPSLGLARLGIGRRTVPRVGALLRTRREAGAAPVSFWRDAYALHDTTLIALSPEVRESWAVPASVRRGGTRLRDNIRLASPPLVPSPEADRDAALAALGLSRGEIVVALLADPPSAGDAMRFMFTVGLMYVAGKRVTGVVPAGASNLRRAARLVRAHGRRFGLAVSAAPLPRLLAGADVAVWDAEGPPGTAETSGPVSLACAAAAGVPVVAARSPLAGRLLGDLSPVLLARDATAGAIADRMLPLVADAALRRRTGEAFRSSLGARCEAEPFERTLLEVWREVANAPVIRPGFPAPPALAGALA